MPSAGHGALATWAPSVGGGDACPTPGDTHRDLGPAGTGQTRPASRPLPPVPLLPRQPGGAVRVHGGPRRARGSRGRRPHARVRPVGHLPAERGGAAAAHRGGEGAGRGDAAGRSPARSPGRSLGGGRRGGRLVRPPGEPPSPPGPRWLGQVPPVVGEGTVSWNHGGGPSLGRELCGFEKLSVAGSWQPFCSVETRLPLQSLGAPPGGAVSRPACCPPVGPQAVLPSLGAHLGLDFLCREGSGPRAPVILKVPLPVP